MFAYDLLGRPASVLLRITPQASSLISTISPLVTIILAVIYLGEDFTFTDTIGTALIVLGVGFYAWSDARAAKAPAAES